MTVTEDAPAAVTAASEPTAAAPAATGLAAILGSGDHKVVGRLWIVASIFHLLLAGAAALAVAAERMDLSGVDIVAADMLGPLYAYRSIGAAFLFLLPFTIGVATAIVPLQVGASTIAFPRAATAAAWTYLLSGGLLVGSILIDGGPFGTDADGVLLFVSAFVLLLVALAVAWICIATTVVSLRPHGMTMARVPLFAWSNLVAATVWLIALPVLAAVAVLAFIDIRYGGGNGFFGGGEATLYGRISWAFGTPAVYAFAIPALGVIGSVVPVFTQTRHQRHRIAQGLIGAFGALSVGAWAIPGYGSEAYHWLYEGPWVVVSFAILLPVLGLFGLWAMTGRQGRLTMASPLLFAGAALTMLLVGLLAGAVQAVEPLETLVDGDASPLYGTSWSSSVAAYIGLATMIALAGGLVYWAPKLIGRTFAEGGTRVVALVLLAGTVLWAFPELIAGLMGQPALPLMGPIDNTSTIETLNIVSLIGGVVLALGAAGLVALFVSAARSDELPGDDPWSGHTLEWATSSPPPVDNFASLPEIASEAPLYDARHRSEEGSA